MQQHNQVNFFERCSDKAIIDEAILRLLQQVRKDTGKKLEHGEFKIVFFQGAFKYIEYQLKDRIFNK